MSSGGTLHFTGFYLGTGAAQTIGEYDARTVEILNLSTGTKVIWAKEFVDLASSKRGGMVQLATTGPMPVPKLVSRTGLDSSATQIHSLPGPIYSVSDTAGTTALTIVPGTAGAGEVTVTYDVDGLATLVFGDGAVTAYKVLMSELNSTEPALIDWMTAAEGVSPAGDGATGFTVGTADAVNDDGVQYFYRMTN